MLQWPSFIYPLKDSLGDGIELTGVQVTRPLGHAASPFFRWIRVALVAVLTLIELRRVRTKRVTVVVSPAGSDLTHQFLGPIGLLQ